MESLGLNFGFLLLQFFNLLLISGWFLIAALALFQLRNLGLSDTARAIWTALILMIPLGGAIAFWIVRSGKQT